MSSFPHSLPAARTPPSEAAPALRWGVLGTGWIADRFVRSLLRHTRQQVLAVGSRDPDRSTAFPTLQVMDEIRRQIGVSFPGEH